MACPPGVLKPASECAVRRCCDHNVSALHVVLLGVAAAACVVVGKAFRWVWCRERIGAAHDHTRTVGVRDRARYSIFVAGLRLTPVGTEPLLGVIAQLDSDIEGDREAIKEESADCSGHCRLVSGAVLAVLKSASGRAVRGRSVLHMVPMGATLPQVLWPIYPSIAA